MKFSQIFRKAARHETAPRGMCAAISKAHPTDPRRAKAAAEYLAELFRPEHAHLAWWGWHWADGMIQYTEAGDAFSQAFVGDCRILALLFAAEIARSEGL